MIHYKSGSLFLCIVVHAAIDVLSVVAAETVWGSCVVFMIQGI